MNVTAVFRNLSPEDQAFVLIGLGARKVKGRRDLLKGGLADLKKTGEMIRKATGDLAVGSLLDLGTLYAYGLGLLK